MTTVTSTTYINQTLNVLFPELLQKQEQQLESTFETISNEFKDGLKTIKHTRDQYVHTSRLLDQVIPNIHEIFNDSITEPVKSETVEALESKLDLLDRALSIQHQNALHVIAEVHLTAEIFFDQIELLKEKQTLFANITTNVCEIQKIIQDQESQETAIFRQIHDQELKSNEQRFSQEQQKKKDIREMKRKQHELEIKKWKTKEKARLDREKFEYSKSEKETLFQLKQLKLNNEAREIEANHQNLLASYEKSEEQNKGLSKKIKRLEKMLNSRDEELECLYTKLKNKKIKNRFK